VGDVAVDAEEFEANELPGFILVHPSHAARGIPERTKIEGVFADSYGRIQEAVQGGDQGEENLTVVVLFSSRDGSQALAKASKSLAVRWHE
jgi:hypothetical protein